MENLFKWIFLVASFIFLFIDSLAFCFSCFQNVDGGLSLISTEVAIKKYF